MSNDVVLGGALRTNLLSLQRTQGNIDKIQNILATGLKVGSALDNPQNFFAAKSLNDRGSDLTRLLDGIGQSIQTVKAADQGVTALGKLIDQADSIAQSAQEEVSGGAREAVVTGNVDLRGISDIDSIDGIATGDTIGISYIGEDGSEVRESVAIGANDSIEQVITAINDLGSDAQGPGAGQLVNASLTNDGFLQIKSETGSSFTVDFDSDTDLAAFAAGDRELGAALGFGDVARQTDNGGAFATNGRFEVTASNATTLVSGKFYDATSGFADASDALTTIRDQANGSGTVRFAAGDTASAGENSTLRFTVNGTTNIDVTLENTTIQGLVDGINNSTSNDGLIEASYNADTGEFSIAAVGDNVETIGTSIRTTALDAGANEADFDFGTDTNVAVTGASSGEGETFVLASAAGTLSQLEKDYDEVLNQIDQLVGDSGYRGVNLLEGDTLTTFFNEDRTSSLETQGSSLTATSLGLEKSDFSTSSKITSIRDDILAAQGTVRQFGTSIANSLSIISTREEFTEDLVNTLREGADKLTVADQNEEGTKLLALQTRQQLGTTTLSLAVQSQQSVLRLF